MRIRLHGTEDECQHAAAALARVLDITDTSRPYPDRPPSRLVRIYLTTNQPAPKEETAR